MQECSETNLKKHEWDEFIRNNNGDYRQYYDWGTLKKKIWLGDSQTRYIR